MNILVITSAGVSIVFIHAGQMNDFKESLGLTFVQLEQVTNVIPSLNVWNVTRHMKKKRTRKFI